MTAYYNEINQYAAQWLRNLIAAGYIADGDVDERSIEDVAADDLVGYDQCHFFAGIGGWSLALRLAGWPDDRPVWTGSCPCQPFSAAGRKKGMQDDRHLWPVWFDLIRECKPVTIFGEQVEAAINHGWLDLVQTDLEGEGYAVGAVGLPAACVGAPHIRQRLWFVADANDKGLEGRNRTQHKGSVSSRSDGVDGCMGNTTCERCEKTGIYGARPAERSAGASAGTGNTDQSPWSGADWIYCRDERWRPVESGIVPLAYGISGRVDALQAYGNAIVPQVAAEGIRAYMEIKK